MGNKIEKIEGKYNNKLNQFIKKFTCYYENGEDSGNEMYIELRALISETCKDQCLICANEAKEWWEHVSNTIPIMGKYPNGLNNDIKNCNNVLGVNDIREEIKNLKNP